jgi:hypothetical protein
MNTLASIAVFILTFIVIVLVAIAVTTGWKRKRTETPKLDKAIFRRNRRDL